MVLNFIAYLKLVTVFLWKLLITLAMHIVTQHCETKFTKLKKQRLLVERRTMGVNRKLYIVI